jgi:hypothetical protein
VAAAAAKRPLVVLFRNKSPAPNNNTQTLAGQTYRNNNQPFSLGAKPSYGHLLVAGHAN